MEKKQPGKRAKENRELTKLPKNIYNPQFYPRLRKSEPNVDNEEPEDV